MNYQPKTPFIEVGEKDAPEAIKLLDQNELDNINETYHKNQWHICDSLRSAHYLPAPLVLGAIVEINTYCPFFEKGLCLDDDKSEWRELNMLTNDLPIDDKIGVAISQSLWENMYNVILDIRSGDDARADATLFSKPVTCLVCGKDTIHNDGYFIICPECRQKYYMKDSAEISA